MAKPGRAQMYSSLGFRLASIFNAPVEIKRTNGIASFGTTDAINFFLQDIVSLWMTLKEVAEGMRYLHSKDIIHCDLNGMFSRCRKINLLPLPTIQH